LIERIHILGASGSGTTTLAKVLCSHLNYECFDTDEYFWEPTNPPFQKKRDVQVRKRLLRDKLDSNKRWILSGSLCGWGDEFIPYFDLVIYLWIPQDIRIPRLIERERRRYGKEIEIGGTMYKAHLEFVEWASKYDKGDINMRSKALHNQWLSELKCHILKIEEDIDLEEKLQRVLEVLKTVNGGKLKNE
jgi:adenylate kinase family enzyme